MKAMFYFGVLNATEVTFSYLERAMISQSYEPTRVLNYDALQKCQLIIHISRNTFIFPS